MRPTGGLLDAMPQHHAADDLVTPPYGIEPRHIDDNPPGHVRRLAQYLLIGTPLVVALVGFLGGGAPARFRASSPTVTMTVETPGILRSGNWFETRVVVDLKVDVDDLTIAVDQSLWRQMSIDTMIPDAESMEAVDGQYTYRFGPVGRGKRFVMKLDGQIQPAWFRRLEGDVAVRDGARTLASVPVSAAVLP